MIVFLLVLTSMQHIDGTAMFTFDPQKVVQLEGHVLAVHEAHWYAPFDKNLVAEVQTPAGLHIFMDLGGLKQYKERPKPGQHIQASGMTVTQEDRFYFLTQELTLDKHTYTIRSAGGKPSLMRQRDKKTFFHRMNRMRRMRKMR